ncbi:MULTISPECIES: response regulator [Vibrio]|jgi:CheY-like chemotaxis protein|uniref:Response regulator n=6 Tax=Vibrio harveyi group TaxID=717610 RepID=A0A0H0Y725_VIBAL|nr:MULTISPECIES: response regulator [Vibrio]EEZ83658.1 response regulator [Vibrio alginolyticus 40B]MDG2664202.1 response regulator [Vibrio parahaemolyticus]MDW1810619.1 response regulator [Vibrio sp. Vb2362]MDW2259180.1 response regulator [Vibrio sp. 1409]MDW2294929.1 response regulator [Vibrio sp. 1404]QCO86727.1 response regulator [Vibrio neocaledonicus]QIR89188.1 response regulator [Vibrio diabolicus]GAK17463.1 response regulator [Vibrio sp. JCM 19053]
MFKTHSQTAMVSAQEVINQKLIMLVDDDPIFRKVTNAYLESQGFKVVEAENGLEALQQLRECQPDLILCDLSMPVLDGIEFVEEVSLEYPYMPLIVVSGTDEMSDVAKALRFGIKDFLPKPIGNYEHLSQAIENTLEDTDSHFSEQRDFSSQWFRVDDGGEIPDEQELYWHLEYLQQNPSAARDLLQALLPEKDAAQGDWRCSYRLLQSTDVMPLVFDYRWLMNGQFAFYLVDSASQANDGVATTLLVRALFDDYLRNLKSFSADLKDMVGIIEKGIECSECAGAVNAVFGVADLASSSVSILPAGLDSHWSDGNTNQHIAAGNRLGGGSMKNFITRDLPLSVAGQLSIGCLGSSSFSLSITRKSRLV